ncbi:hypothetical protein D3C80_1432370 [compost metagenome]
MRLVNQRAIRPAAIANDHFQTQVIVPDPPVDVIDEVLEISLRNRVVPMCYHPDRVRLVLVVIPAGVCLRQLITQHVDVDVIFVVDDVGHTSTRNQILALRVEDTQERLEIFDLQFGNNFHRSVVGILEDVPDLGRGQVDVLNTNTIHESPRIPSLQFSVTPLRLKQRILSLSSRRKTGDLDPVIEEHAVITIEVSVASPTDIRLLNTEVCDLLGVKNSDHQLPGMSVQPICSVGRDV